MSKKKWFGLTGGIASGKSTVSGLLSDMGAHIIDADLLARAAVQPESLGYKKIIDEFGPDYVLQNGQIDRKALGRVIFSDSKLRKSLESIIHPEVRRLSLEQLEEAESKGYFPIFYDVPLLFEKKMQELFSGIVVVACDPEVQVHRLMQRDNISQEEAMTKIRAQIPIGQKVKVADFVIWNNSNLEDLKEEAGNIMSFLREPS